MTEAADSTPSSNTVPDANQRAKIKNLAVQGSFLLGEVVAFLWLIERLESAEWIEAVFVGQFVLAMVTASISLYCATLRRRRVYDPIARLEALLPSVRAGEMPIDTLGQVTGQMEPLARQVMEILAELKAAKSGMKHEIRQHVAHKTEALERTIGSLRQQASRDVLTGLMNRRGLQEHLGNTFERSGKTGLPVSVLMIDVDNFKPLNDTLGHAAGDELLRSLGQLLRSTLRDSDTAFRVGGDEFVIVLEGATLKSAAILADRLTQLVDGLTKTLKVPERPRLSIGSACVAELKNPSAEALLELADKRLYDVKVERKSKSPIAGTNPRDAAVLRRAG